MTRQAALKKAQGLWGKRAAVRVEPKGGRIGYHGEYLRGHIGNNKKDDPRFGMYYCKACSSTESDGNGGLIERRAWHPLGGTQAAYTLGVIALGMFFEVRAEADSFEAAFAEVTRQAVQS